jgi:subtilisin family serine protease
MTSLRRALLVLALIIATTGSASPGASATTTCSSTEPDRAEVVVKLAPGHSIDEVLASYPIELGPRLLSSHGVHAVRATDPQYCGTKNWSKKLAQQLRAHDAVKYAESNIPADLSDGRYHAWPDGDPDDAGSDPAVWRNQSATQQLQLSQSHELSKGDGTLVAILDTGVDPSHPALAGLLQDGWDYVDDDPDPSDLQNGRDDDGDLAVDESFGHGTFVSGIVALTAPKARIMPMRVLNSDGRGNLFVVAEAITDAVKAGADVIVLAFGTETKPEPTKFEDAIKLARARGVVVVASAGNESSTDQRYPAALGEVLAVSALRTDSLQLAAFSNSGSWVDVAAAGMHIAGPVPGGRYAYWNGTSVAAPFVAGQAALIRSRRPPQDATKTIRAIQQTTSVIKVKGQPDVHPINILQSLKYGS